MAKRPFFKQTKPLADFVAMEREILSFWYKSRVIAKYLTKNKNSQKLFRFLDGPITANNPMGVHHAWGRTYKDLWQRFKNMQGYAGRFQNGFDAQGLWVEVEVEKELGLKSKKDIENLVPDDPKASMAKFVEACKKRVQRFSKIQTEQSKRLGYFMDWENSYITMSDENNYMIWHFLKKCSERGLIYKGLDSVPWCPRCGTAISQHEILTEEYQQILHKAIYVKFPITGRSSEYLLVWTTTPWTIPANVGVAVGKDLTYSKVKAGREQFFVAKDALVRIFGTSVEVIEEVPGSYLLGINYEGPYDDLPAVAEAKNQNPRTFHTVIDGGELVQPSEGTGLVHIAPGAGHEDYQLAKKEQLSVILAIDEEANYLDGFGKLSGKNAAKNPDIILDDLRDGGWIFRVENYRHRYPVCWRCKTELVFRAVPEWYIKMDPLRGQMVEITERINWIPEFALERELDWLRNMSDWLISKKRYWGLALPIWECSNCGHFTVIGSKEELKQKAVSGWKEFENHSPHRPWVDEVKIACVKCGSKASRIPDVGNPWLDAGIVPFSTLIDPKTKKISYITDKKYWGEWFPFDFITESFPGQFKGWFYSLLAMSTVLEEREPFRTVLGFATLLGEDGRPMHKSLGNAIEFNEGADKIGVDVMRWMYARQDPAQNLLFGYKLANLTRRSFLLPLWNVYNFFVTYALNDSWYPTKLSKNAPKSTNVLDKWISLRLSQLCEKVTSALENYEADLPALEIEQFLSDLSLWYIRRSRERVGPDFYQTCYFVLINLCQIMAPFAPFISEEIYKNLTGELSVHLTDWPKLGQVKGRDLKLLEDMERTREIVERGHNARKISRIPVRQPLQSIKVKIPLSPLTRPFVQLIKDELNIKKVLWKKAKELSVEIDTKITEELLEEGKARELIRSIQEKRKELGMGLKDEVLVTSSWLPKNKKLLEWISKKTLSQNLLAGDKFEIKKV